MKPFFALTTLALLFSSCRYGAATLNINGDTIVETSIPVIKKDPEGFLRNYLAREMASSRSLYYKDTGAKYSLKVSIEQDTNSKITFLWDRDPVTNENLKVFYPSEGMREVVVKVELVEEESGDAVIEPFFISASADYDFVNPTVPDTVQFLDALGGEESVLQYSLGQLDSEEGAKDTSYNPVYQRLAKKIVNRLMRSSTKVKK
ncbi:MAG: hypothetical protein SP4CHLAM5_05570 [Chlamydiia bacterium]|nr:hypothetical protein [Chlamydiia bacterium]MCH9618427.1 hypothetical protein [Chlamydiia bacterium]MCH9623753.1 hypothetical protein [Chlamydiia bacterium]